MRCKIREKTYICGDYRHILLYPVMCDVKKSSRRKKYNPSSDTQSRLNKKKSELNLQMLLENNFDDKDFFITVTYVPGQHPSSDDIAVKDVRNFIRRMQYQQKKKNADNDIKAVWCTEKGKNSGKFHHHIVMKCDLTRNEIRKIWGKGLTDIKELYFDSTGLKGLAKYMPKEPVGVFRYHHTKNIQKPAETKNDSMSRKQFNKIYEIVHFRNIKELEKIYEGFGVSYDCMEDYESFIGQYIYLKIYKKTSKYIK